jgi:hypothetical protein
MARENAESALPIGKRHGERSSKMLKAWLQWLLVLSLVMADSLACLAYGRVGEMVLTWLIAVWFLKFPRREQL